MQGLGLPNDSARAAIFDTGYTHQAPILHRNRGFSNRRRAAVPRRHPGLRPDEQLFLEDSSSLWRSHGGNRRMRQHRSQIQQGSESLGAITEYTADSDLFDFLSMLCGNDRDSAQMEISNQGDVEDEPYEEEVYEEDDEEDYCHAKKVCKRDRNDVPSSVVHQNGKSRCPTTEDEVQLIEDNYHTRLRLLGSESFCAVPGCVDQSFIDKIEGSRHRRATVDRQGLIWNSATQRQKILLARKTAYCSYEHWPGSIETAERDVDCLLTSSPDLTASASNSLLRFDRFYTQPDLKLVHFQLRNLMTSYSSREVYYASAGKGSDNNEFNSLVRLDLTDGSIHEINVPPEELCRETKFTISTVTSSRNHYVASGSFDGSVRLYYPQTGKRSCTQISQESDRIINYILTTENPAALTDLVIASNDKTVSVLDILKGKITSRIRFDHSINCICENPNSFNELLLVGDSCQSMVVDKRQSNKVPIYTFEHHHDYSFACDWSADHMVATGNQDSTVRLYDDRKFSQPLFTVGGAYHQSVRNLKFSKNRHNGRQLLAFAESIDNVYVVDLGSKPRYQHIHFFGKLGGLDFNSSDELEDELTIGVTDKMVGGVLRYKLDNFDEVMTPTDDLCIL